MRLHPSLPQKPTNSAFFLPSWELDGFRLHGCRQALSYKTTKRDTKINDRKGLIKLALGNKSHRFFIAPSVIIA
jgi:hypothetical protein